MLNTALLQRNLTSILEYKALLVVRQILTLNLRLVSWLRVYLI